MATTVLDQMLAAAAKAAGNVWSEVQDDATAFAQNLIQDAAQVAADYAAQNIDADDLKTDLQLLGDYTGILKNYALTATKAAVQAACNAAVDTLWSAIASGAKLA